MALPEYVQQLPVCDMCRVVDNLDCLAVVAEAVVGGIVFGAARISYTGADYTVYAPEPGVGPPESAHGECSRLGYLRYLCVERRYRDIAG